jgi:uncharacterized protein (DUF697 family)/tellurite resistance protein
MNIPGTETTSTQDSLLAVCLFAAFCDGDKSEVEREQIGRMAEELGTGNLAPISRQILMGKLPIDTAIAEIKTREDRMLAYEMARGICEANGSISSDEQSFLTDLKSKLGLDETETTPIDAEVDALTLSPIDATPPLTQAPNNSGMILKYAILNGALELLPETLATMAIIPMQMKMVYRIGKSHGVELDRSSIKEFLATAGLGFGSQVVEGFARKLVRGFGKKLIGKTTGRIAEQITGSAFSFASTYAIGHIAEKYHTSGRTLSSPEIKNLYQSLSTQAKDLHTKHLPEIQQRAKSLNPAAILSMVRGTTPV